MTNRMLELAKAEGHKPRHKMPSAPINTFKFKSYNQERAEQFIAQWRGGPFTSKDIASTVGPANASRCTTANYMVTQNLARRVGKRAATAVLFELTGEPT